MPVPADRETFLSESTCVKLSLERIRISLLLLGKEVRCLKCGRRKAEGPR